MKRKIIEIDQEKCTGCGKCIPNCPEGALQIIDGKAVKCIPDGVTIPKDGPVCLLNHNVKEFSNLAKILAPIYAEEKDNWF